MCSNQHRSEMIYNRKSINKQQRRKNKRPFIIARGGEQLWENEAGAWRDARTLVI